MGNGTRGNRTERRRSQRREDAPALPRLANGATSSGASMAPDSLPGTRLFGTDGVRGLANSGVMTPETAFRIGAAVTYAARKRLKRAPRIVVGKDTRISGYMFETALASGICALGGRVMLSGPLPTPAVAHITQSM